MPIRERRLPTDLPAEEDLRRELIAELEKPKETGEPLIVIERPHPSVVHLYVIWSKWEGLEQSLCSRIILDAYEATKGEEEADNVSLAMALTPEEAKRLGLS